MTTPLPGEFAGLLTTALRRIKANTNKTLDAIKDELGYTLKRDTGGSFIDYLRRGNVPTDTADLEALSSTLFCLKALDEEELMRFLRTGGHANPRTAVHAIVTAECGNDSDSKRGGMASQAQSAQPDGAFVAGPPITRPRQFFGRERELRRIFGWWQQLPMSHVALVGPKRSGKTSLLHYLRRIHDAPPGSLRAGQKHDWLPNAKSYRWVWVDFQDARMRKLDLLLGHMLSELDIASPAHDLDSFMDILTEPHRWRQPTVIVMDDIAAGLRAPELTQALWDSLRALSSSATDGNLAFIVSAHTDPARLAEEQAKTSHFFNIFNTLELGPFTEAEARALIGSGPHAIPEDDAAWVLARSGRWPALIQLLCQEWQIAHDECAESSESLDDDDKSWRGEALRRIAPYAHLAPPQPGVTS
jgi:hypothetical protein